MGHVSRAVCYNSHAGVYYSVIRRQSSNTTMSRQTFLLTLITIAQSFAPIVYPPCYRSFLLNMVAVDTSDIKNGMTLDLEGEPHKVMSFSTMKQARGAAKMTIKLKNLMRGTTIENTYRSGEKFETALINKRSAQFTYQDGVRERQVLVSPSIVRVSSQFAFSVFEILALGIILFHGQ